jgi:peptidoglycan hydrolase CwlO-like protein
MLTNDMTTDMHNFDNRITVVENIIKTINDTMNRLEGRFDKVDQEIKKLRNELKDEIKDVRTELGADIRTNFFWSLGAFIGVLGSRIDSSFI